MTDFSKVPLKNIHIVDKTLNKRFVVDELEVVYKESDSSCDFVNHILVRYSCCDNSRCIGFTEEKFKFDGTNICDDDIYLECIEGMNIPVKENRLWSSKCFVERIDGTVEPIKCMDIKHFCGILSEEDDILFTRFIVDGHKVVGKFSMEGLPLCNDVSEYRLIYRGDTDDKQ